MTIHPAGTPLARVAIGEAIADLPFPTTSDIVTPVLTDDPRYPVTPLSSALEFVRFLTERDGQRIHVWKRTK